MQSPQVTPSAPSPVRRYEVGWLIVLGLLSAVWCLTSATRLSATFDEPIYLREGLARWRNGTTSGLMKYGTMPLPVDVQTLPLYLWEQYRGAPFDVDADFHTLLPLARAMTLLFWWLLLFHIWLAGRSLGGTWAGVIATTFVAIEPSLLAHASLATTDIAVTACLVGLVYHFHGNRTSANWWWRIAWPAFWFGLAVLAKASGLVFGALCLFVVEGLRCGWWRSRLEGGPASSFRESFRDLFHIGLLGMALVFVYCGSDFQPQRSLVKWAHSLPEGTAKTGMIWVAENFRVFSNAGDGLVRQVTHNVRGHGSYILGQTHPRALWYYFPLLLTIKVTVPLLLAAVVLGGRRLRSRSWNGNWALVCALSLLLFSVVCRVQIGIRFMFPLLCFAIIGLSAVLVEAWKETTAPWRKRLLAGATLASGLWTLAGTLTVWPHGLCYVNPLWGGTEEGYRIVSEANYDWGQGVKELDRWHEEHGRTPLLAWHFSADPVIERLPLTVMNLSAEKLHNEADFLRRVRGNYLAVSTTVLKGALPCPSMPIVKKVLDARSPAGRTMTFLIYDFTNEPVPTKRKSRASLNPAP